MKDEYCVFVLPHFENKGSELLVVTKIKVICKKMPWSNSPFTAYAIFKVNEEVYQRLKDQEFFYGYQTSYEKIGENLQIEEFMI